jgi:hypothetical protein
MKSILIIFLMCMSSVTFAHGSSHQTKWEYHIDDLGTPYMQCGRLMYSELSTLFVTVGNLQYRLLPEIIGRETMAGAVKEKGQRCYGHGFYNSWR